MISFHIQVCFNPPKQLDVVVYIAYYNFVTSSNPNSLCAKIILKHSNIQEGGTACFVVERTYRYLPKRQI